MAHSINSPSSFSRRIACPGSAKMEIQFPSTTSIYAAEGTAAHELGEKCLLQNKNPEDFMGQKMGEFTDSEGKGKDFIVDGDMVNAVKVYVDHCRALQNENSAVESKLQLPFLGEGEKGTADFISLHDGILHVVDYKHGQGVPVNAIENVQGICYGLGAAKKFEALEWDKMRITIVQPRSFHTDGPVRSWDVSREELLDYKMKFATAALLTQEENPELNAGEHCRFCRAQKVCKEYANFVSESTKVNLFEEDAKPVDPKLLTDEEVVDLVLNKNT
jgi:hypothetical protein